MVSNLVKNDTEINLVTVKNKLFAFGGYKKNVHWKFSIKNLTFLLLLKFQRILSQILKRLLQLVALKLTSCTLTQRLSSLTNTVV